MRIHQTPERLRPAAISYPIHHVGPNIEEAFTLYALDHASEIDTPWIYLPIHWQNLYFRNERHSKTRDFYPDPEAQDVVNNLDPKETYFTLSQADDGTYEKLPPNVKLFSAGGTGDYAIPLLTSPLPHKECKRDILASFAGISECGGPIDWPGGRAEHSSWNPDGRGAQVRRAMFKALAGKPSFELRETRSSMGPAYHDGYVDLMCRSIFALCPRGYGKTSFRMYEAMQLGAIPVYIFDNAAPWLPFSKWIAPETIPDFYDSTTFLDWTKFCWLCPASQIHRLEEELKLAPSFAVEFSAMQKRVKEVHDAYFNLKVAPKRIAELVERVSR